MSKDDESRRSSRLGQALPGYSALSEVFGAAIDGASRMTRTRAKRLAERLLSQAGLDNVDLGEAASEATARINQLAEEIIAARKANQALLQRTVKAELERSLQRLGLARTDEVAKLREEITELRNDLAALTIASAGTASSAGKKAASTTAAKKAAARRAQTRKTAAKRTTAARSTTEAASARAAAARRTALKKSAAASGSATTGTAKKSTGADA